MVKSNLNTKYEIEKNETNLEVSSRWNHLALVNYLISLPPLTQVIKLNVSRSNSVVRNKYFLHNREEENNAFDIAKSNIKELIYSREELKNAYNLSSNKEIKKLIKIYLKKNHGGRCGCI